MYVMYCLSLTGHLFMILHIVLMILIYWPTFNFKFGQDIPGKKDFWIKLIILPSQLTWKVLVGILVSSPKRNVVLFPIFLFKMTAYG